MGELSVRFKEISPMGDPLVQCWWLNTKRRLFERIRFRKLSNC